MCMYVYPRYRLFKTKKKRMMYLRDDDADSHIHIHMYVCIFEGLPIQDKRILREERISMYMYTYVFTHDHMHVCIYPYKYIHARVCTCDICMQVSRFHSTVFFNTPQYAVTQHRDTHDYRICIHMHTYTNALLVPLQSPFHHTATTQ